MALADFRYGKGRVRVMRLGRASPVHQVRELSFQVLLHGGFERSFTDADNRSVIATDTIKNIVGALAHDHLTDENEAFVQKVASFFLEKYPHVSSVDVDAVETRWHRLSIDGAPHDHAFTLDGNGKSTVGVRASREGSVTKSGVVGFTFMKTTESGWTDFHTDEYRTLADTTDRIAATSMESSWTWTRPPASYEAANKLILDTALKVFATTYSHGVQDSLYRMGEAVLEAVPEMGDISFACPNKHYIPINLAPFKRENRGQVFLPTDEPHGQIEATVSRG